MNEAKWTRRERPDPPSYHEVHVARVALPPNGGDANLGLVHVLGGHSRAVQHRLRRTKRIEHRVRVRVCCVMLCVRRRIDGEEEEDEEEKE